MTTRAFTTYEAAERVLAQIPDEARDTLALSEEKGKWSVTIADQFGAYLTNADDADGTGVLKTYATARRYDVEVAGVTWNGVALPTDREKRAALVQALQTAQAGLIPFPVTFGLGTTKLSLTEPQLTAAVAAIAAHVQGAFDKWGAAIDGIAAGTIITTAQIDALFDA